MQLTYFIVGHLVINKKYKYLIIVYSVVMACLAILNMAIIYFDKECDYLIKLDGNDAAKQKWDIKQILNKYTKNEFIDQHEKIRNEEFSRNWFIIQKDYYCCGVQSYEDVRRCVNRNCCVPKSCCRDENCAMSVRLLR